MMLNIFSKKNAFKKGAGKATVTFSHLSKKDQDKILKKGAEHFSKKFTKVIVKLANE